ncbi:hypothetical protein PTTG_00138 [Puccinia triticina 1-1 BBBD Race 1]|uniref:Secreted protein n=2 Tax=Puccinia triticina TaxID=208348 RepID=A0A180GZG0_PUCT1|nr:uncharacterized protein PtA15_9A654 [Puccinia triticina]OAV97403.1 hypothetical protein PTTG_00138 [Puccinia triticina 1-1 BBBD Race 1]WAQ88527.1 hypothetical protein PtA15_9A654 [Puccinia triticina]WAR60708.1 hypothetical protein PtB15_9B647 [Puccinia triticina]
MHHSFFTTALLLASNVFAQDAPTNTTATNAQVNPQATAAGGAPPVPNAIAVTCTNSHLPFSQRELAQMALMDANADRTKIPDPKTLSANQTAAICKNDQTTAVCVLNTCDIVANPSPSKPLRHIPIPGLTADPKYPSTACHGCVEYTPNAKGDDGTLGTVITDPVVCDDSYNFNVTETRTPYLCSTKTQMTYSCKKCEGARGCNTCYDVKDIPAGPTAPPATTAPVTPPANP